MPIATYYMPKQLEENVKFLADDLGIKITEIRTEENNIRVYCVGSWKLLDTFNARRLDLLAPQY